MIGLKNLIPIAFAAGSVAFPFRHNNSEPKTYGCGEVDIVFTGLPGHHPLVTAQGFNGTAVQNGLEDDTRNIIAAGYNAKVVLMGPEQPMSVFHDQVGGHIWKGVGLGYGVRGSHYDNLTVRAEDILNYYHTVAPLAPIMFDLNYTTALWAIERHFPIEEDCTNSPGKLLGFEIICDICE